ncbi:FHA domain-containing protein [Ramlibacter henchirensis]|uniref:FHA domain-containing protein n=1 Tax=Ramlibacter henchirensis TaxID=204072 RepID=A0A4Z0C2X0_9BURK|nr:FHA domain-containing protein [Ramlibacter henchirensis]TFZ05292.1 FHA domain-containing protein [Ramlibacter henchirensis]
MPQLIITVEGVEVRQVYLSRDRTTLGRAPENDIVLQNPAISSQHCAFDLKRLSDVFVEDLGSTNGTFVNNKRVKRQRLRDEDVVAISSFRIRFLTASADSGFRATAAMAFSPSQPAAAAHASFRVLTGSSAGLEVPVNKAVSTFGKPGVAVIVVAHRPSGYYAAHLDGEEVPQLNGRPLRQDPVLLAHHDVLELAGTQMQFVLAN